MKYSTILLLSLSLLAGCATPVQTPVAPPAMVAKFGDSWGVGGGFSQPASTPMPSATVAALGPAVHLAWDPAGDGLVYQVYYGTFPHSYEHMLAVGTNCAATVKGLETGGVYYFAVTSVDGDGNESDDSPQAAGVGAPILELHFSDPGEALEASTNLSDWQQRAALQVADYWLVQIHAGVPQEFYRLKTSP